MKITLLGTGSPEAHARRASSGYLVEIGDDKILLDCGGGVYDRLVSIGLQPSDITHIFFTHLHSDHMMDYARLVHGAWDEAGHDFDVWGPAPIAEISNRYFGPDGALAFDLAARIEHPGSQEVWVARGGALPRPRPMPRITEIEPGFTHQGNGWTLRSSLATHAQPWLSCMAFRIDTADGAFVFSGDSGPCPELEAMAQGCDILLHWAYRLSGETKNVAVAKNSSGPEEIGAVAARVGATRLILTHLRAHMDTEENHAQMLTEARSRFDGAVEIAEDLAVYSIPDDV